MNGASASDRASRCGDSSPAGAVCRDRCGSSPAYAVSGDRGDSSIRRAPRERSDPGEETRRCAPIAAGCSGTGGRVVAEWAAESSGIRNWSRVSGARILVVGAGAVGNEILKLPALLSTLFGGALGPVAGEIRMGGKRVAIDLPRQAFALSLALLPAGTKKQQTISCLLFANPETNPRIASTQAARSLGPPRTWVLIFMCSPPF